MFDMSFRGKLVCYGIQFGKMMRGEFVHGRLGFELLFNIGKRKTTRECRKFKDCQKLFQLSSNQTKFLYALRSLFGMVILGHTYIMHTELKC